MSRFKQLIVTALLAAVLYPTNATAGTFTISKNNPYKSFNISGINYGSMQWEREHGPSKTNSPRRGDRFRR